MITNLEIQKGDDITIDGKVVSASKEFVQIESLHHHHYYIYIEDIKTYRPNSKGGNTVDFTKMSDENLIRMLRDYAKTRKGEVSALTSAAASRIEALVNEVETNKEDKDDLK